MVTDPGTDQRNADAQLAVAGGISAGTRSPYAPPSATAQRQDKRAFRHDLAADTKTLIEEVMSSHGGIAVSK
jgi:hypothetical protein